MEENSHKTQQRRQSLDAIDDIPDHPYAARQRSAGLEYQETRFQSAATAVPKTSGRSAETPDALQAPSLCTSPSFRSATCCSGLCESRETVHRSRFAVSQSWDRSSAPTNLSGRGAVVWAGDRPDRNGCTDSSALTFHLPRHVVKVSRAGRVSHKLLADWPSTPEPTRRAGYPDLRIRTAVSRPDTPH